MDRDDLVSRWWRRPWRRAIRICPRKLPTVQLGGKNRPRKGGLLLTRSIWRKMRMRWLRLRYSTILRKLKEFYQQAIRDIADAGDSYEAFQQRILMEAACAVPVGVGLNSFPTVARQRSITI
ncbi:hypothetical protein MLD38_028970 [Melastoma candidum]|uniref:Uncharacterized protein n=1 Tax=Melastoma candidum TaxID=119954 RepID=A0ACB9N8A5_9MYRT|nr:hypothetical protein MLD38_028970 [Melastoma candidum]